MVAQARTPAAAGHPRPAGLAGGPSPGRHNFFRGVPLAARDDRTREAIASLEGACGADALTSAWEAALAAPVWPGPPAWIHGDLQSGNLLVVNGRLSGVIDFGGLGVGDPACDLQVAWNLFAGDSRQAFRAALAVDDAGHEDAGGRCRSR